MIDKIEKLRYPNLFYEADSYSKSNQKAFFIVLLLQLLFTVLIAVMTLLTTIDKRIEHITTILLFLLLAAAAFSYLAPFLKRWYLARSLAESIKTLSWRYAMSAAPFNIDEELATKLFTKRIRQLLEEHKDIASEFSIDPSQGILSDSMLAIRRLGNDNAKKTTICNLESKTNGNGIQQRQENSTRWHIV